MDAKQAQLINQIKQFLSHGMSREDIKKKLTSEGWSEEQVDAGLSSASGKKSNSGEQGKKGSVWHVLIPVIVIIIIILILLGLYVTGMFQRPTNTAVTQTEQSATTTADAHPKQTFEGFCKSKRIADYVNGLKESSVEGTVVCNDSKEGWSIYGKSKDQKMYYCMDSRGTDEWIDETENTSSIVCPPRAEKGATASSSAPASASASTSTSGNTF